MDETERMRQAALACGRAVYLTKHLGILQAEVEKVAAERREALIAAHDAGWTWDRIAAGVGMHRVSLMRVIRASGKRAGLDPEPAAPTASR